MSFLIKDILNKPFVAKKNTSVTAKHNEKILSLNNSFIYQKIPIVNNIIKKPLAIRSDCNYFYLNPHYNNNSVHNNFSVNVKPDESSQFFNHWSKYGM